ncbi:MAG: AtuA-related protein [Acidobacteriota bacterium]
MERFELPNLLAFNFLLHRALGGGGTKSLRIDPQGKTLGEALLLMEIAAPEEILG